jgi:monothiol glutaredoxin
MSESARKDIAETIKNNPIVLYVKGNPEMPQCGFSKVVMDIFGKLGVPFKTVDVLSNPDIRDGIKVFTQWPTIPQVFIHGEFVGGCDIIRDLYSKGELEKLVQK